MSGASIVADQDRPGPSVSHGSPGVARNDLWINWLVTLGDGAGGNNAWAWTILYKPPGSSVVLSDADGDGVAHTSAPTFTPDLKGTYRIRLITNTGGPGNIQIKVFRVRYDDTGTLVGWVFPAFGEQDGESNFPGNDTAWAENIEYNLTDAQSRIETLEDDGGGGPTGPTGCSRPRRCNRCNGRDRTGRPHGVNGLYRCDRDDRIYRGNGRHGPDRSCRDHRTSRIQ